MFYNGFTLLMQMFAGAMMYWVGRYFGFMAGERSMYKTMTSLQQGSKQSPFNSPRIIANE